MSHVYTLTATGHRVPRWFTEGLAVHEETAISPDWGDRLESRRHQRHQEQEAAADRRTGSRLRASHRARQVIVSYFQAGRICDYINEKWGWDTLLAMLHDFGAGEDTPDGGAQGTED